MPVATRLPSRTAVRRLGLATLGLLAMILAWFGWDAWHDERRSQLRDMRTVLEITATAIDRYLREVEAGLGAAAYDFEHDGIDDLADVQRLLRRFHDAHPDAASITLSRRADGAVLASSLTPRLSDLPRNVGVGGPIFPASHDDSRLAGRLILGRPLVGAMVGRWIFPLSYMVYDRDGRIQAVLSMAMPVDFVQAFWNAAPLAESTSIGIVRDDGVLASHWKLPAGVPLDRVYGLGRPGALQQHLMRANFPPSGTFEGRDGLTGEDAAFVFRRLERFGATVYVSQPTAEVRRAWIERVRIPYALAALLALLGHVGQRALLRREALIEVERRAADVAAQASAAKSRFIARMSHELRTPLNAVLGFAELLARDRREPLSATQSERVRLIEQTAGHLRTLIDDLLDLSQIEAGALALRPSTFRPAELVADVVGQMRPLAHECGVALTSEIGCPVDTVVHLDRTRLRQIMLNLVSNAIKYNRPGGRVHVEVHCRPARLELVVDDDGIGMTPAQVASLYEPFNRLGRDGATAGVGIGLSITRQLVERCGGTLDVDSEVGRGSRFRVELPRPALPDAAGDAVATVSPPTSDAAIAATPGLAAGVGAAARTVRVLHVDDDPVNRLLMEGFMQLVPGVAIESHADGPAFVAAARARPPDVALIDVMMAGMDGFDVLRALRADPALRGVACIAVSANAMPEDLRRAREAGFDGCVTKPISVDALHAQIMRALGLRAASPPV